MLEQDFKDIITNIKTEIRTTQIKTAIQTNKNLIFQNHNQKNLIDF